jgi:hypothetical protein
MRTPAWSSLLIASTEMALAGHLNQISTQWASCEEVDSRGDED